MTRVTNLVDDLGNRSRLALIPAAPSTGTDG